MEYDQTWLEQNKGNNMKKFLRMTIFYAVGAAMGYIVSILQG